MSETTFETPAESVADVAQQHDFDTAQPEAAPADDDGYFAPSREEWEQTQEAIRYYGGIVEQHQAQARVEELRDQFIELELTDPAEFERVVRQIEFQPHLNRIAQLEQYVGALAEEQTFAAAEDEGLAVGLDKLAELGYEGDQAVQMYDEADARFENAVHLGIEHFGGDVNAFWAYVAEQGGVALEQAPYWLAEQALGRLDAEQRFGERIANASSLVEMVREAPAYATTNPAISIGSERPDSLKDIARKYTQGGR